MTRLDARRILPDARVDASPSDRRRRWRSAEPVGFIGPAVVVLGLFLAYPVGYAVWTSLNENKLTRPDQHSFVGLENYTTVFSDPTFWEAVLRTGIWAAANLTLQLGLGMVLALVLHQKLIARGFYRSIVIIPWIVPTVVVAVIWRFLLDPTSGPINHLLMWSGLVSQPPLWLANTSTAFPILIGISAWKWTPFVAVILLAGLQTVPPELHESAMIDGAGRWQRFRYVVMPHLSTSVALSSLLTVAYSVNNFNGIWLFTKGGPVGSTETLTVMAYRIAFREFDFGKAATVAIVLFVALLAVSTVYFFLVEGRKERRA